MIKTLIFDFGDVFINLDKAAPEKALQQLGAASFSKEMIAQNIHYEVGTVSTQAFVSWYEEQFPNATQQQLIEAWNAIILDFPEHRLDFIKELSAKNSYQLILLINTNALHIEKVKESMTPKRFNQFKACFDAFYLSHEIHLRKPHPEIFEFVLEEHQLSANECLFVDDTPENTATAKQLGIHVWNNQPVSEDVTDLFSKMKHLF